MSGVVTGDDSRARCPWPGEDPLYLEYHDREWGRAVTDDHRLFEKIVLEGFQAGLSWITVLHKRPAFREAFAGFDPEVVAAFGPSDVERLVGDAGIIRHRGKIESAINNAGRALELMGEWGGLTPYLWSHAPRDRRPAPETLGDLVAQTAESVSLSEDLKRRGWRFVGPTTLHAMMQAVGIVNDHLEGCFARAECDGLRGEALARL